MGTPLKPEGTKENEEDILKKCTPVSYLVDDGETCIPLLLSKEPDIISKTLCNLCKNIETDDKIVDFLLPKQLFERVTNLLKQELDLDNLKYVLKLYGLIVNDITRIPKLDQNLLYDSFSRLLRLFFLNKEDFVKEASSLILIKVITSNPIFSIYICYNKHLNNIIKVLQSSIDPDVLKNGLELLLLLMNGEDFREQLNYFKRKHMNIFICFLDCDVEAIADLAMEVLYRISNMKIDKVSIKMAKGNTLPKMVYIIKNKIKRYTDKAIEIIDNCVQNKEAAIYFVFKLEFVTLLGFLVECDNNTLIKILPIFSTMTKIPLIKKRLYYESGEDILFQSLKYRNEDVVLNMCKIITNFTMHKDCLEKMLTPQLMKYLLEVFDGFPMDPHKINAMLAIYSFVKYEPTAINYLKYTGGLEVIQNIFLNEQENFSPNIYEMIIEIICTTICSPLKTKLDIPKMCEKILDLLRLGHPNNKILLKMISMLVQESDFRTQFILSNGPEYFLSVIQTDSFSQTCQINLNIIKNLLTYEEVRNQFLNLGLMTIMKSMMTKKHFNSGLFQGIISGLYDSCLTAKFFDKKTLDNNDIINDLFFLIQEYKLNEDSTEFKPIYIVNNFVNDDDTSESISTQETKNLPPPPPPPVPAPASGSGSRSTSESESTTQDNILIKTLNNHSGGMRAILSCSTGDYTFHEDFLPYDDYLDQYIEDIQDELLRPPSEEGFQPKDENDECSEYEYDSSQLELKPMENTKKIALFVERQLSGIVFADSEEEKLAIFKRHIDEICTKLGHRFIPIGYLRMGYLCEKALLYKVLCDSIGIPSGFHQEKEGLFWNSISKGVEKSNIYIVDFKNNIGELIQIDSEEAREYLEREKE